MSNIDIDVTGLPRNVHEIFRELTRALVELTRDGLLGFSAFGGWLRDDSFYEGTPARSVAVVERFDLQALDRFAGQGVRFGKRGLSAPLIMTPAYIQASCDVFPLELLEIQQLHALLTGKDHFAELKFTPGDLRLQCERELKSELIQLRQGLLAAAGQHKLLGDLCRNGADRTTRVLRGVLHLKGETVAQHADELLARSVDITGVALDAIHRVVSGTAQVGFTEFETFYAELTNLAGYVDKLDSRSSPPANRSKA